MAPLKINTVIRISPALARYIANRIQYGETPSRVLERELGVERDPDGRSTTEVAALRRKARHQDTWKSIP